MRLDAIHPAKPADGLSAISGYVALRGEARRRVASRGGAKRRGAVRGGAVRRDAGRSVAKTFIHQTP